MKKLWWWNLSDREKAKRSFVLTPIIGILVFLKLHDLSFSVGRGWGIVLGSMALMALQGFYYQRKSGISSDSVGRETRPE